jgi:hypothetical protein
MTTLMDRFPATPQRYPVYHLDVNPVEVVTANLGQYSLLQVAQAYLDLGEAPILLCHRNHEFASGQHLNGFRRNDGSVVSPCKSPGKAPLERNYPRFGQERPTNADMVRMFSRHQGNIGGVVSQGRIVIDIDPRSGGLESIDAYVQKYGPLPGTPTVLTGGGGIHYHFRLPNGITLPSGGSLAALGYPGVEWKAQGSQVVLPPSIHHSGQAYYWEPGFNLAELPFAPIPDSLLQLILQQMHGFGDPPAHGSSSRSIKYSVQPPRVQGHFASLWQKVGVDLQPGSGDRFYSCPFHQEQHPSMHIDTQRCIWFCFSPQCPGHRGGGVRELEALLGPLETGPLPICHLRPRTPSIDSDASELGSTLIPTPLTLTQSSRNWKARPKTCSPYRKVSNPR